MGVKLHAMSDDDYVGLGSYVKATGSADTFGLLSDGLDSSILFGDESVNGALCTSLDRMHKRAVIPLVKPVCNYVLGRSNMNLLRKILGWDQAHFEGFLNMSILMDDDGNLCDYNDADRDGHYYMGAELLAHLISDFNIEAAIIEEISNIVAESLRKGSEVSDFGEIRKGSGDILVAGDYYLVIEDEKAFVDSLKRGRTRDSISEYVQNVYFSGCESRLTYLLNIPKDKSSLYGMLNYQVAVVPSEMRPKVQRREHKLTTRYTAVITANNELRAVTGINANLVEVREKYLALDRAVSKLQYKNIGTGSASVSPDDASVLERVKSKKGQVRMRNLGKRQDNSFRCVVTVSPFLPLDMIQIPECVLPAIYEPVILPYLVKLIKDNNDAKKNGSGYSAVIDKIKLTDLRNEDAKKEILKIIKDNKLLEKYPIPIGRQPTLHKHGIQAFYAEITDSKTIGVNPLVCPGFNMDFDGDSAWGKLFARAFSNVELRDLLLTTQNLYLAKNGECTIEPRQEMLYGLYICTRDGYTKGSPVKTYEDLEEVYADVTLHQVRVTDTVSVKGSSMLAGDAAFISCFPDNTVVPRDAAPGSGQLRVREITSKTIGAYINKLLERDKNGELIHSLGTRYAPRNTFVGAVNRLVKLGFKVAYFYTPSVSLLQETKSIPEYDNAIENFYKDMEPYDEVYDAGLETAENYKMAFDKCLSKMSNSLSNNIYEKLGDQNGYVMMAKSGARGKQANLTQMFAAKGQVKKNNHEAFDVLLEDCYVKQLTPMAHHIAGFGGRQGQIDKSLRTADTGYASRKMWHTTQGLHITTLDCGTTDGINVSKNMFTKYVDAESGSYLQELHSMFAHAIVGKFTTDGKFIDEATANAYAENDGIQTVKVRSPLKCNNPCCQKCYGMNWETHKLAVVGTNVGMIAAEAMGEVMSQLTLNNFHSGGVVSSGQSTSAFDKVNAYLSCTDLGAASAKGSYIGYDPLAWATGEVEVSPGTNVRENIIRIGESKHKIAVPNTLRVKEYVNKGEGLSYKHGDYSIPEVLRYCGIDEAQLYLVNKLYSLYMSECDLCSVHFEVIVEEMTRYMIVSAGNTDLMVGQYYNRSDYISKANDTVVAVPRLVSVKELPLTSQDALDTILMENHSQGLSRACALCLSDRLEKPMNRMLFGLSIKTGSALPNYISERKDRV